MAGVEKKMIIVYNNHHWDHSFNCFLHITQFVSSSFDERNSRAHKMAILEMLKKIGRINFIKFLQIMYSEYNINFDYTFNEMKLIYNYEKYIKRKRIINIFVRWNNNSNSIYLPNLAIKTITDYLKPKNNNTGNKSWISKKIAYKEYCGEMMEDEDHLSYKNMRIYNFIIRQSKEGEDYITTKKRLSTPEWWNSKTVKKLKSYISYLRRYRTGGYSSELNLSGRKSELIAKISKYIGCNINYNEEKTLSDENFSGLCSREVYLNVKELRSKKARGMHLCKNERAYLNRWGDLFS